VNECEIFLDFSWSRDGMEVAVAYFRSGYSPNHYPTEKVSEFLASSKQLAMSLQTFVAGFCPDN